MAAVVGTAAVAGMLVRMPQDALAFSWSKTRLPFHAQSLRARGRCHAQTIRQPRSLFVATRAAQAEAKQAAEEEKEEEEKEEEDESESESNGITDEAPPSVTQSLLESFREALAASDEPVLADIQSQLQAIEEEREVLSQQVASLMDEVSAGKDRVLRLNADFENYRKRSERERLQVKSNVRGEVIESLLPMVDNFERAKASIKTETDAEQKIDNSYQGIYKQFVEIMKGLGVVAVDTVGKEFDPMVHEAIMREESSEYDEGVVIQEFRRGFSIGDKLLRPAMVKVSAGPPAKSPDVPESEEPLEDPLSSE